MVNETLERLPRSARLLVDFVQYCEIKRDCPHLFLGENATPRCRHSDSGGPCNFEDCPMIKAGGEG